MSKLRFTDCDIWETPWFMELTLEHKLFWRYLCDRCDNAGVWIPNRRLVALHIGCDINLESALQALVGEVEKLPNGKWRIVNFIAFQYRGGLSDKSAPHRAVKRALEAHGLAPDGSLLSSQPSSLHSRLKEQEQELDYNKKGSAEGGADCADGDNLAATLNQPTQSPAKPLSSEQRWLLERSEEWAQTFIAKGLQIGARNWLVAHDCVKEYGLEKCLAAIAIAYKADPDGCWPSAMKKILVQGIPEPTTASPREPTPLEICDQIIANIGWMAAAKYLSLCDRITTKRTLSDLLFDAPECQQELIAGYRKVTQP